MTKKQRRILIAALLIFGFCALEFPGILFVCDRVTPFIFGLPFLYGYVLCGWIYMCLVLLYACRTGWGKHPLKGPVSPPAGSD
ncbi:MAG: hypothetical protein IJ109_04345 [Firmicutes bacterium]|nr:hypothetical protein [Bacillota bacterium]